MHPRFRLFQVLIAGFTQKLCMRGEDFICCERIYGCEKLLHCTIALRETSALHYCTLGDYCNALLSSGRQLNCTVALWETIALHYRAQRGTIAVSMVCKVVPAATPAHPVKVLYHPTQGELTSFSSSSSSSSLCSSLSSSSINFICYSESDVNF